MAIVNDLTGMLSEWAHPSLQESYDNSGLQCGDPSWQLKGVLFTLDVTEAVVDQAIEKGCNLIVSHHPVIFGGLTQLTGRSYTERILLKAIKHDIALFAIHTNLDNVASGVNSAIANKLGLGNTKILRPLTGQLKKLVTFVPTAHADVVRTALFDAGAGQIGAYDHCSYNSSGKGTFRSGETTSPFAGEKGEDHTEEEVRMEVILEKWKVPAVIDSLNKAHPYEEVAYDLYPLDNEFADTGAGMVGELPEPMDQEAFLRMLKEKMAAEVVRYSGKTQKPIQRVAVCGGSGSFLIRDAQRAGADCLVTADLKYHQFFDATDNFLLADIGHYESEQFTTDLIMKYIRQKFANFAPQLPLIKGMNTNPVKYLT